MSGASSRVDRVLLVLLAASLLFNVAVVWWFVEERRSARGRSDVAVGMMLKPIIGVSPSGQEVTISYGGDQRPVVLYVFSPTCVWCERNLHSIAALSELAKAHFRFIGVSLSTPTATPTQSFPFPVVLTMAPTPFRSTPQTIVVGSDGRVVRSWLGAYVGVTKAEVEQYFTVRLPEIPLASKGG